MSDVVDRIRSLAGQGCYVDDYESQPDPSDPPRPAPRPDGKLELFAVGRWRRSLAPTTYYRRGTEDLRAAWERGLVAPPAPLTVATEAQVARTEELLGVRLPPLLKRLYLEVGNGGFGPLKGIPGGESGFETREGDLLYMNRNIEYLRQHGDPVTGAFPDLVTFLCWGGGTWSAIDCRSPDGWMYVLEGFRAEPTGMTLDEWFQRWIDRRIRNGRRA